MPLKKLEKSPIKGLYAITDPSLMTDDTLLGMVEQAITGGAAIIQYRDKRPDKGHLDRARALRELTRRTGTTFIVNDDPELALQVQADGIHIGQDDPEIELVRAECKHLLIGVSCYNRLDLALEAQAQGADYIAFGSFYPSRTKQNAVRAEPSLLDRARSKIHLPIVAIGGITPQNGASLLSAGVDALAVVSSLFDTKDVKAAAGRFNALFQTED